MADGAVKVKCYSCGQLTLALTGHRVQNLSEENAVMLLLESWLTYRPRFKTYSVLENAMVMFFEKNIITELSYLLYHFSNKMEYNKILTDRWT